MKCIHKEIHLALTCSLIYLTIHLINLTEQQMGEETPYHPLHLLVSDANGSAGAAQIDIRG